MWYLICENPRLGNPSSRKNGLKAAFTVLALMIFTLLPAPAVLGSQCRQVFPLPEGPSSAPGGPQPLRLEQIQAGDMLVDEQLGLLVVDQRLSTPPGLLVKVADRHRNAVMRRRGNEEGLLHMQTRFLDIEGRNISKVQTKAAGEIIRKRVERIVGFRRAAYFFALFELSKRVDLAEKHYDAYGDQPITAVYEQILKSQRTVDAQPGSVSAHIQAPLLREQLKVWKGLLREFNAQDPQWNSLVQFISRVSLETGEDLIRSGITRMLSRNSPQSWSWLGERSGGVTFKGGEPDVLDISTYNFRDYLPQDVVHYAISVLWGQGLKRVLEGYRGDEQRSVDIQQQKISLNDWQKVHRATDARLAEAFANEVYELNFAQGNAPLTKYKIATVPVADSETLPILQRVVGHLQSYFREKDILNVLKFDADRTLPIDGMFEGKWNHRWHRLAANSGRFVVSSPESVWGESILLIFTAREQTFNIEARLADAKRALFDSGAAEVKVLWVSP